MQEVGQSLGTGDPMLLRIVTLFFHYMGLQVIFGEPIVRFYMVGFKVQERRATKSHVNRSTFLDILERLSQPAFTSFPSQLRHFVSLFLTLNRFLSISIVHFKQVNADWFSGTWFILTSE